MTLRTRTATLPFIVAAVFAFDAQAAKLELIDHQVEVTRNGQPVPSAETGISRAFPDEIQFESVIDIVEETSQEEPDFSVFHISEQTGFWVIEPDQDEMPGEPVCYQYSHVASSSAESSGQAAAGAVIGGGAANADAQADAQAGTYSYDVEVTGPGGIDGDQLGSVLTFGPVELTSGDDAISLSRSGTFLTAIGDSFSVQQSMAAAVAGVHSGSATVQAASLIEILETELESCYPVIDLAPNPTDFGSQEVGTSSDPVSITLAHTGTVDLEVESITAPTEPFAFAGGSCPEPPFNLPPGASCTLEYAFGPTSTGPVFQSLVLESNAPDGPLAFELQGNGTRADLVLAPATTDFGSLEVGTSSGPATVTVESTGDADLVVDSVTSPTEPFAAAGGTCASAPFTLPPGSACTLDFSFSPTTAGSASQLIVLESNAQDGPAEFELLGLGTQAQAILSLDDVDFGEHEFGTSSETRSIEISNVGDAELVIDSIGSPEPPFEITGGSCYPLPAAIAPGESCTIEGRMSPTSWSGPFNGEIRIFSNSPSSPDRITLRGTSPAPVPVPTLGLPAAVVLILTIIAITRRSNRQRTIG